MNQVTELYSRFELYCSRRGRPEPLTDQQLAEMFLWTSKHGPPNCWTGTTGGAATMIRELLREVVRLKSMK